MKRKLLAMALGIAAMLTGCQKEDLGQSSALNGTATFSVAVDNGIATRAEVEAPTRYIMEVYQVANPADVASGTAQRFEETTGSFDVVLKEGTNYVCLFWADYGTKDGTSNEYSTDNLTAVSVASQATKEAFGGSVRFTYDSEATDKSYLNVTLTHAVAQVNFKQINDFTTDNNTLKVEYPKTFALNLDGNKTTEILTSEASTKTTHTFTGIAKASANKTIGTSYIIVADASKTVMDITATFNSEVRPVTNVPFQRNYKTNITGAYSNLYTSELTITCDDEWETQEYDYIFGPKQVGYKIGDYYPDAINPATAIGVVCWLDATDAGYVASDGTNPAVGLKGKIVSHDDLKAVAWGPANLLIGGTSDIDGTANTTKIKAILGWQTDYPAFAWCDAKNTQAVDGINWYLPAVKELRQIAAAFHGLVWVASNAGTGEIEDWGDDSSMPWDPKYTEARTAFQNQLTSIIGGVAIPTSSSNRYWSSTESDKDNAMDTKIDSGGFSSSMSKSMATPNVRAISAFDSTGN